MPEVSTEPQPVRDLAISPSSLTSSAVAPSSVISTKTTRVFSSEGVAMNWRMDFSSLTANDMMGVPSSSLEPPKEMVVPSSSVLEK